MKDKLLGHHVFVTDAYLTRERSESECLAKVLQSYQNSDDLYFGFQVLILVSLAYSSTHDFAYLQRLGVQGGSLNSFKCTTMNGLDHTPFLISGDYLTSRGEFQ